MAFWKKSEDPWDIDPDERRLASEPAEKAPGLVDTIREEWDGRAAGEAGKAAAAAGEVPLVRQGHGAGLPYERQGCFLVPGHPHRKGAVAQSRRWKYHAGGHRRLFDYLPHGLVLPGL